MATYRRKWNAGEETVPTTVGYSASLFMEIIDLQCKDTNILCCWAPVVFAFIFRCRSVTVHHCFAQDLTIQPNGFIDFLFWRKGRSVPRSLVLRCPRNPTWTTVATPFAIPYAWNVTPSPGHRFFNMIPHGNSANAPSSLFVAPGAALRVTNTPPPLGARYTSHSSCIGAFNELTCAGVSREVVMRRLDRDSKAILWIHNDSSISCSSQTDLFFAPLQVWLVLRISFRFCSSNFCFVYTFVCWWGLPGK